MFAQVLTSRQHGVATVWLVATFGSKSTLKKVTRKAILDVEIPKACRTIQDPAAPMALRLQGNLLYGVSRVYSQQCGYVLADTQNFRDKMRGVVVVMKEMEIDPEAGMARPDQLILPDDPAFLPDLDMNPDMSLFDFSTDAPHRLSLMSPPSLLSSRSSQPGDIIEEPVLVFPSTDITPLGRDLHGFGFGGDTSSALKAASKAGRVSMVEDTGGIEDNGFEFDQYGNIIEAPLAGQRESIAPSSTRPASRLGSDSAVSARVRQEHEAGVQGVQFDKDLTLDEGILACGDDDLPLPDAAPFSTTHPPSANPTQNFRQSASARPEDEEEPFSSAEATQQRRKARIPKPLQPDVPQEMQNADLAHWNTNYLANMAEATRSKQQHKSIAQAKKNAAFFVLGQGIAGVGIGAAQDRVPNPLMMFTGPALLALLTGREVSQAPPPGNGTKRTRNASENLDEEVNGNVRRVRARGESDEQQIGRAGEGDDMVVGDDDMGMVMFPGDDRDIEVGRQAPESLQGDHSSQMPWNASISRYGSAHPAFGSGLAGIMSSSVGGLGGGVELVGPPSSLVGRHGRRLTSASPLLGRGIGAMQRYSSLELPEQTKVASGGGNDDDPLADDGRSGGLQFSEDSLDDPDFQLYGPAARVDTQTAAQSQWVAAALDTETHNFLAFLTTEIDAKSATAMVGKVGEEEEDEDGDMGKAKVSFDEMLPPQQHSQIVAAQGLLHVLALATKGLIEVKQEEAFGRIEIGIVSDVGSRGCAVDV